MISSVSDDARAVFGPGTTQARMREEADGYVARATLMIDRARALVLGDQVSATAVLTARRAALGAHFQRYQRFKHGCIFDPVVRHGTPSSQIVARTMKLDCLQLGDTFGAYHTRWLGLNARDWAIYREDMLEITDMLKVSLAAELRAMRQLLTIAAFYAD